MLKIELANRLKAYDEFRGLRRTHPLKTSVDYVHSEYGISKGTLYMWNKGRQSPYGRIGSIRRCKELFYVIGAFLGDGCLYTWGGKAGYRVILTGNEAFCKKYACRIRKCTGTKVKAYINRRNHHWFVSVGNGVLFVLLQEIRANPWHVWALMEGISENLKAFVEGFFDAEGCVKLVKERVRNTPKVCLDITNTNRTYLEIIRRCLDSSLSIEVRYSQQAPDGMMRKKIAYHLRIYRKAYVKEFFANINTIKLTPSKVPHVNKWLSVPNCHPRHL